MKQVQVSTTGVSPVWLVVVILAMAASLAAQQEPTNNQAPAGAPAQAAAAHGPMIPDTYTNLMVLPKDISKKQLMSVMKGFCISSGVRCSHCHAVPDDLSSGSFASDEKEAKVHARELMRAILATRTDISTPK